MKILKITSGQALNTIAVSQAIGAYIQDRLHIPTLFIGDNSWQDRYQMFDDGQIQAAWICGLPYVHRADQPNSSIELLVAPVMAGNRYQNKPVYFSDVVVHRDSPFQTFTDLRGASWAYNEPGSHSGYNITRYYLAQQGETAAFFGRVIASGEHHISLQMILKRQIDASAIDSTVLEWELEHDPQIRSQIRIITTWGPSPIPPWVILRSVPDAMRQQLRQLLLEMHLNAQGQAILAVGKLRRFASVTDGDYDPIRQMTRLARSVSFGG